MNNCSTQQIKFTNGEGWHFQSEWNYTQTEYPDDMSIYSLFKKQAERTPESIALDFEDGQLTYRELNKCADRLSYNLMKLGIGSEMVVGIISDISSVTIVGLLAILKAGGAYMPLDPAYPWERLSFMMEDAQASVLLAPKKHLNTLPPDHGFRTFALDSCMEAKPISDEFLKNQQYSGSAEDLAYVMYTSGSTGRPKGVAVTHRNVSRLVFNTNYISLKSKDRVAQLSNIAFDAATFEIWGALLHGARLIGVSRDIALSPLRFSAYIRERKISVTLLTTALFNQIAREYPDAFCTLRYLLFGGEAVNPKWVKIVCENGSPKILLHVYGPTECTTLSTWYPIREVSENAATIPIGRPISNTQVYILDKDLVPLSPGIPGEMYIGGPGVARGYLNRPNLTRKKFIPDPFSKESGAHLYRTGDIARFLPDGNIEFIGRMDNQVKIRGFRIELGEIETALSQCPNVDQVTTVIREHRPGDKEIVAYIIPASGCRRSKTELRKYLEERLPTFMIPSSLVFMDAFPLTPNGKVDRNALPVPEISGAGDQPRTSMERILSEIWGRVLGIEYVGINDNFFEMGGHSLLAVEVISRVRKVLNLEIPVSRFFNNPTISGLATILEKHSCKQIHGAVHPVPRDRILPLSYPQQQIWFLCRLYPDDPVYNETCSFRLGKIDQNILEKSLTEIVRRHEILRTTFEIKGSSTIQVIHEPMPFPLRKIDLRDIPGGRREMEALRLAEEELKKPFDLSTGPLLQGTLIRLHDHDFRLFIAIHHIVTDGVSMYDVFFPELEVIYAAFSSGLPSPLPKSTVQYADFSAWQREQLNKDTLAPHLEYWEKQLVDLPVLKLPTDRQYSAEMTFRGDRECLSLGRELTDALKSFSRERGTTLFTTLSAVFHALLHRYTGQEDLVTGTFTAGRDRHEIQGCMGDFLNTLVIRVDLSGNPTVIELLDRVRKTIADALDHQDLPFDVLVASLQPKREAGRNPLFQVAFVLEPPLPKRETAWSLSQLDIHSGTSKFDLTLELEDCPEGIIGRCEYSTDLFDALTIKRMIGHFQVLLEGFIANPQQHISELPILTEAERHQILVEWNDTCVEYPRNRCIHHLFDEQTEKSPSAVSVVFEDKQLTYRKLNAQANRLARYLQSLGVGPEVLVGICMDRSVEMIIGLLAILKAGGAYVPLDPAYPEERIAYMIEDSGTRIVLIGENIATDTFQREDSCIATVCLDRDLSVIKGYDSSAPSSDVSPYNLAYVLYTSGSTGRPKGVAIEHRSPVALIHWGSRVYSLEELSGVLAGTSICFDLSVFEIFLPLSVGGKVILTRNPLEIPENENTTLINTVPSVMEQILRSRKIPDSVITVNLAGETLFSTLVDKIYEKKTIQKVYDLYGPSEDTTYSTYILRQKGGPETYGKPIENTRIYILDRYLQLVPIGVPGEVHIAGLGLARGYHNRPDLTAEKFIRNPYSSKSYDRLYKTGDIASYLPDGNLKPLGRIDHQVKIRGFRIELGEIQLLLKKHLQVRNNIVVMNESKSGDKRLIAYIEPTNKIQSSELRNFLSKKLPEYMIPSAFVILDKMPLTPNGKIDRKALPEPDKFDFIRKDCFIPPRNLIELRLKKLWEDILNVRPIGCRDSFFNLGGHSLLAVFLMSTIQQEFGRHLPLSTLFSSPTIEALAEIIEEQSDALSWNPLVPIQSNGSGRPFFCMPGAGGNVIYFHELANCMGSNVTFYGLQARGLDGKTEPFSSIEEMAAHNIKAIRHVQPQGPYYLGGHSLGGGVAYEMAQQLQDMGQQTEFLAIFDIPAFTPPEKPIRPDWDDAKWITVIAHVIEQLSGKKLEMTNDGLQGLTFEDQMIQLKERMALNGIIPSSAGIEHVRGIAAVIRANELAFMNYSPLGRYSGQITLFKTSDVYNDPFGFPVQIPEDETWGWSRLSDRPVRIFDTVGDHTTILKRPHVQMLAERLKECIR